MTHFFRTSAALAGLVLLTVPAFAQNSATVNVADSEAYGNYLTDADGRALYLFETDMKAEGDTEAQISCAGECLVRWPPFYTEGEPQAGEMADASKLGTVQHDGKMMVTYNGWPLYYFVGDQAPGETKGHDIEEFGGEWYLVTSEGGEVQDD